MLLETCRKRLKQANPNATVINGGLSGLQHGFAGTLLTGEYPLDYLSFSLRVPRYAFPLPQGIEAPSDELQDLTFRTREWLEDTGRTFISPWAVDVGVRTSPIEASKIGQAEELARCAGITCGYGGGMAWRRASDGAEKTDRYGLIRRNLEAKPALVALAAAAAATYGTKLVGVVEKGGGIHVGVLRGPDEYLAVAWTDRGQRSVTVEGDKVVLDMWGNKLSAYAARAGRTPIYIAGPGVAKLVETD